MQYTGNNLIPMSSYDHEPTNQIIHWIADVLTCRLADLLTR